MIILFDVDGVLVHNLAYRAGIQQTARYFGERLGVAAEPPTQAEIDVFEAESITVEWDSCAIVASAYLLARLGAAPAGARQRKALAGLPGDFWQALQALPPQAGQHIEIDYGALARRAGAAARATGQLPARAALDFFLDDLAKSPAHSPAAAALLRHLLGQVYDIDESPAMQVFQNYVLGDQHYAAYYGLTPRVSGEGLLQALDKPLLSAANARRVLAARAAGELFPILYTARPSLAPLEAGGGQRGYTPEGEIGGQLAGLEGVPVMGIGKLAWLAERLGRSGSELVKPSPLHAMAALAAARTGLELESIKAALAVERGGYLRYPLTACAGETVHVFEDSPSSLRAVAQAVATLNRLGLRLSLTRHGVAPPGSPKRKPLAAEADVVHDDINEGIESVL